ncbi:MAG: dehydrogenase [Prevotella sp.]|nr:dehydrogenase [Prevotella sp.]
MADGYLESRQQEYEKRKQVWLKKKRKDIHRNVQRPDDESL